MEPMKEILPRLKRNSDSYDYDDLIRELDEMKLILAKKLAEVDEALETLQAAVADLTP